MLSRISYFIFNEITLPHLWFQLFLLHSSTSTLALGMVAVCWVYPPVVATPPVARRAAWRSLERRRVKRRGGPPPMVLGMPIYQWSFPVPLIGGRYHIITQLAIYKWYISGIYCQLGDYISPTTY